MLTFSLFTSIFKRVQIFLNRRDSNASILKATMKDEGNVFIKIFEETNLDLIFEKDIYEYISQKVKENNHYHVYFVEPVFFFSILGSELRLLIQTKFFSPNKLFHGIVTRNYSNSYKLSEFFPSILERDKIKLILRVIFEVLYGIYIMNTTLFIIHNDLHFGNIIYETDIQEYKQEYLIEGLKFTLLKNFNLRIFDYDCSSRFDNKMRNPRLDTDYCKTYGSCNRYSQKDVFILIVTLIEYIIKYKFTYLNPIISVLLDNKLHLKKAIVDNLKNERVFWSVFCSVENNRFVTENCSDTSFEFLDINKVILRFLKKYKNEF